MVSVAGSIGFGAASRAPGRSGGEINATPRDALWYARIAPKPRVNLPWRARVFFPSGWATFDSPEDAENYLEGHSVEVEAAARRYIEWTHGGADR